MSPAYILLRNFLIFTLALASLSCTPTQPPPEVFRYRVFKKLSVPIILLLLLNKRMIRVLQWLLSTRSIRRVRLSIILLKFSFPHRLLY